GNRHVFLAFAEIHPDYYQIPVADREALIAEEAALARAAEESGNGETGGKARKSRRGGRSRKAEAEKPAETAEQAVEIAGFGVIDLEPAEAASDDEVTDGAPEAVADDAGSNETASADAEATVEGPAPETEVAAAADAEVIEQAPAPAEDGAAPDVVPEEPTSEGAGDAPEADASAEEAPVDEAVAAETSEADTTEAEATEGEAAEAPAETPAETTEAAADEPPAEDGDPKPPTTMAESAGLGDDDEVLRGDVPPEAPEGAGPAPSQKPEETPAPAEVAEQPEPPVAEETAVADEAPVEAAAPEAPADTEAAPQAPAQVDAEPGADAPEVAESPAEPAAEAAAAKPGRRSRSRRRRKEPVGEESEAATEDAATAPAAEEASAGAEGETVQAETAEGDAAGDAEAEAATTEDDTSPAKPRRSRRGGRGRGRKQAEGAEDDASTEPAEPKAKRTDDDDDADSDREDADEVDTVGADDVREEDLAARAFRRRRYKIQDVIKSRQIMLVQVVKEERGTKGAALTTYLSLAGRYCVLMPNTARGGGISRKITNAPDRKRLREIVGELEVPEGMGLIVRTAGAERTRAEIKRDYEFLLRQWEQVRATTLESSAPCLIYEEGSLIKRAIRDLYSKEIDTIQVEGEDGYREAKDYMKMLMPSHAKNVQQYSDMTPLFIRYQVESYLNGMFSPTVQLKSGGYIVIGITEALVAIDVNSGRSTREGSIEDTAVKTNLEAADEVARQLRLRDLAGLIVIDFIDMDEGRNNRAVEKRMKERLKSDRARIQVGRISAFGLMEMSRQRLRPGMLEATTKPCPHCHGTGIIRSDESMALAILRELEEEGVKGRARELVATTPVGICNYIVNFKRAHLARIEERYGVSVQLLGDPTMTSPEYAIERLKTAARPERAPEPVLTASAIVEEALAEESEAAAESPPAAEVAESAGRPGDDNGGGKKRRRGRRGGRRRRGGENGAEDGEGDEFEAANEPGSEPESEPGEMAVEGEDPVEGGAAETAETASPALEQSEGDGRSRRRRSRGRGRRGKNGDEETSAPDDAAQETPEVAATDEAAAGPDASDAVEEPIAETPADEPVVEESVSEPAAEPEVGETPVTAPVAAPETAPETAPEEAEVDAEVLEATPAEPVAAEAETASDDEAKPKRRGWWSLRR
ncbi:MAG: Rne/Rng family ribonuclease, partial [Pseudomonadota bacterium]